MIQPDEILQKATRLYPEFLAAWLDGADFFPKVIPARKEPDADLSVAALQVQRLRGASKSVLGYGYSVKWKEINSRTHGKNQFPTQILFETQSDFLAYLGKEGEFKAFSDTVSQVRTRYPELEGWIRSHRAATIELSSALDGLLEVVAYLKANPRPDRFARELPLRVDTKFIERHRRVLREWLDLVLPAHTVSAHEDHFERRFGLRYSEPHVLVRFLDHEVQRASGSPWPELSLPLGQLATLSIAPELVLVVENRVNLLTLPRLPGTVAIGGLGNGVVDLRYVSWMRSCSIVYWGDIDVEGLAILSRLRVAFPATTSVLMDDQTLETWRDRLAVAGSAFPISEPMALSTGESRAFRICAASNLRLEQERFPQPVVDNVLRNLKAAAMRPPDRDT